MTIKGKTESGFEYEVNSKIAHNMRFVKACAAARKDPLAFPDLITCLLGEEQEERLYAFLEEKHGEATIENTEPVITEIIEALSENPETKN